MCRNCFKYAEYLSEFDRAVLDIIFTSELPYLDLLYKQISVAAVSDSDCVSSYFIDLCVKETVLPIPTSVSVPVSIEICPDCEPVSADREISEHFRQTGIARWLETGEQSPEFTLPQGYADYCGINMHFKDGIINEIEVVNFAGLPINFNHIISGSSSRKRLYRYNDKNWFDAVAFIELKSPTSQ